MERQVHFSRKGRSIFSRATENGPAFVQCFVCTQRSAGPLALYTAIPIAAQRCAPPATLSQVPVAVCAGGTSARPQTYRVPATTHQCQDSVELWCSPGKCRNEPAHGASGGPTRSDAGSQSWLSAHDCRPPAAGPGHAPSFISVVSSAAAAPAGVPDAGPARNSVSGWQ